jgi:hypothetical protein
VTEQPDSQRQPDESSDGRWSLNNDSDRPPVGAKAWRVQRVWDREGQVVKVDDEKSLNESGMIDFFCNDENMPLDSLVIQTFGQGVMSASLDEADQGAGDSRGIQSTDAQASNRSDYSVKLCSSDHSEKLGPSDHSGTFRRSDHTDDSRETTESDVNSCCSSVLSDDHASFIEDEPLDEDEFEQSLALEVQHGRDNKQDSNTLKLAKKKLRKVEKLLKDLATDESENSSSRRRQNRRLQEKCVKYLSELSEDLSGFPGPENNEVHAESCPRPVESVPSEIVKKSLKSDNRNRASAHSTEREALGRKMTRPVEIECNNVVEEGQQQRDHVALKRKLQKTEKLLNRLVVDKGETIKSAKLYKRLEEKRAGYMGELGLAFEPFDVVSECSTDRSDSDVSSFSEILTTPSLHSLLETAEQLDAIAEEDNGSCCSVEGTNRDLMLLQRKIRKVEKEFNKIKSEKGSDKVRRTNRGQGKKTAAHGRADVGKDENIISSAYRESAKSNQSKDTNNSDFDTVGSKQAASASVVADVDDDEEMSPALGVAKFKPVPFHLGSPIPEGKPKTSSRLAYNSAGKWASPLESAPKNGETKLRLHSLSSVYL